MRELKGIADFSGSLHVLNKSFAILLWSLKVIVREINNVVRN